MKSNILRIGMKGRGRRGGAKKIKEHILKILLLRPKSPAESPDENFLGRSLWKVFLRHVFRLNVAAKHCGRAKRSRINKRTECEPSQFGSSRDHIARPTFETLVKRCCVSWEVFETLAERCCVIWEKCSSTIFFAPPPPLQIKLGGPIAV